MEDIPSSICVGKLFALFDNVSWTALGYQKSYLVRFSEVGDFDHH